MSFNSILTAIWTIFYKNKLNKHNQKKTSKSRFNMATLLLQGIETTLYSSKQKVFQLKSSFCSIVSQIENTIKCFHQVKQAKKSVILK